MADNTSKSGCCTEWSQDDKTREDEEGERGEVYHSIRGSQLERAENTNLSMDVATLMLLWRV